MNPHFFRISVYTLLLSACLAALPRAHADDRIVVELASRRTFVAWVDPRTDSERLWLRFQEGRSFMLRSVAWDAILAMRQGERTLDVENVRALAVAFEPPLEIDGVARFEQAPIRSPNSMSRAADSRARVRSLGVDAWFEKWTSDVGVDGLVVEVAPRNSAGELVRVRGTLEVELFAFRQRGIQRVRHPQRIGRWSVPISTDDFGTYGAVVPLRFQSFHPQRDQTIEPRGLVHVRLSVPGEGTFEASRADVELRPYSAFRDRLDIETGGRFLPSERRPRGVR